MKIILKKLFAASRKQIQDAIGVRTPQTSDTLKILFATNLPDGKQVTQISPNRKGIAAVGAIVAR